MGGIIGGLALLVLVTGFAFFWKRHNRRNLRGHEHEGREHVPLQAEKVYGLHEAPGNFGSREMDAANPSTQPDPSRIRHEMQ